MKKATNIAALYVRVSKEEQKLGMQLHALRAYAKRMEWNTVEYEEKESSVKKRPVFQRMLEDARQGKFQVILLWRIDRWARSMQDFVNTTLLLHQQRVRLISTTENVDTGDDNPFAEFQIGLLALLAQLERKIIVARVTAGVAEAKRQGKHCGRPVRIWRRDEALKMRDQGMSLRAIAAKLVLPLSTVVNGLKRGVPKASAKPGCGSMARNLAKTIEESLGITASCNVTRRRCNTTSLRRIIASRCLKRRTPALTI